jgi:hypothetical protein
MTHESDAEAFFKRWLAMLDALVPIDEYFKFLPDGDFEQWSYPDVEIHNANELAAFYQKTWGTIARQTNTIKSLSVARAPEGRFAVEATVDWEAATATGQTMARSLRYSMTVGTGSSAADSLAQHPKVFRYKIERT